MEEWRAAVSEAYEANQDWPVYVNEEGLFRGVDETTDVAQGVMDSVLWKLGA